MVLFFLFDFLLRLRLLASNAFIYTTDACIKIGNSVRYCISIGYSSFQCIRISNDSFWALWDSFGKIFLNWFFLAGPPCLPYAYGFLPLVLPTATAPFRWRSLVISTARTNYDACGYCCNWMPCEKILWQCIKIGYSSVLY